MSIKYKELRRRVELEGAQKTVHHLTEALEAKYVRPEEFSLRDMALTFCGVEWYQACNPASDVDGRTLNAMEAGDGVDVTAFSNIIGQLIINRIMESYQSPAFVASQLVDTIPTRLDGEKIPGVQKLTDNFDGVVDPSMPYPSYGFGEDYIETPSTKKRGGIVPVTKEAIFFDRTNLVLANAATVGETLGLNKEKRILDVILGVTNNYKWRGTSYNTYQTATPWINDAGSNELIDWTDVEAVELLFANMLDPNTSEPIVINGMQVLVMPEYKHAAQRVFGAKMIRYGAGGSTSVTTVTEADNPLAAYSYQVSALAKRRLIASGVSASNAAKYWFAGDFKKAFAYMENWPITVTQAPPNATAEFERDIVAQFKASERGVAAALNPRYVCRSTN